jgi:hypothetical protein
LRLLMPVLDVRAAAPPGDFPNYAAGTWGPEAAQGLPAQSSQVQPDCAPWRMQCRDGKGMSITARIPQLTKPAA